jgi:hypothetical protein
MLKERPKLIFNPIFILIPANKNNKDTRNSCVNVKMLPSSGMRHFSVLELNYWILETGLNIQLLFEGLNPS